MHFGYQHLTLAYAPERDWKEGTEFRATRDAQR